MKPFCVAVGLCFLAFAPAVCRPQLQRSQFAVFEVADFTRSSPGEFISGWNAGTTITQASTARIGESFEYRFALLGNNSAGLLYSRTSTEAKLVVPPGDLSAQSYVDRWPISRNEFDLLYTHRFTPRLRSFVSPFASAGAGAIALNGGKTESGLDGQGAFVAGGGGDLRIAHRLTLRIGLTADLLKAPTFSDVHYRSSWTVMTEPRIGFVLPLGATEK